MAYSEGFKQLLQRLRDRAGEARRMGMDESSIETITSQVGDWLAQEAEPRTYEQRLLKDFWQVSDDDDKKVLSRALLRVAEKEAPSPVGGHSPDL